MDIMLSKMFFVSEWEWDDGNGGKFVTLVDWKTGGRGWGGDGLDVPELIWFEYG